jgi:PilZ domain
MRPRVSPRYRLERPAKIQIGIDSAPCDCLVIDMSEGGVRLKLNGVIVPNEFVLHLSGDGPARDGAYKVVWRLDQEIGAKFVGTEPTATSR